MIIELRPESVSQGNKYEARGAWVPKKEGALPRGRQRPETLCPRLPRRASPPSCRQSQLTYCAFCVFSPPQTQDRTQSASEPATHASTRVSAANRRQNHKNFALCPRAALGELLAKNYKGHDVPKY